MTWEDFNLPISLQLLLKHSINTLKKDTFVFHRFISGEIKSAVVDSVTWEESVSQSAYNLLKKNRQICYRKVLLCFFTDDY